MALEEKAILEEITLYLQTLNSQGVERAEKKLPTLSGADQSEELSEFCRAFGESIDMLRSAYDFQKKIAAGDLTAEVDKRNFLAMPLRGLQSSLKHLTWQASQVAQGNLKQKVHFLGEFADSFNSMITALQEKERMQTRLLQVQKMESVGQLAAGIAHEINTPAQFVGTNLDFVAESFQDVTLFVKEIEKVLEKAPQEIRDKIHTAMEEMDWEYLSSEFPLAINQSQEGVERISSIVLAMKDFSHPGSKDKVAQGLNQIIETTVTVAGNEWRPVADVRLDLDPELPNVPLFADEMGHVILNILVNAAQAIAAKQAEQAEKEKGIVTITTSQGKNTVELRIQDTGEGISEDVQSRIFGPFFTTRVVGQGVGQGLSICHDVIVGKHQGTLEVASIPGEGAMFIIQLPLEEGTSL